MSDTVQNPLCVYISKNGTIICLFCSLKFLLVCLGITDKNAWKKGKQIVSRNKI